MHFAGRLIYFFNLFALASCTTSNHLPYDQNLLSEQETDLLNRSDFYPINGTLYGISGIPKEKALLGDVFEKKLITISENPTPSITLVERVIVKESDIFASSKHFYRTDDFGFKTNLSGFFSVLSGKISSASNVRVKQLVQKSFEIDESRYPEIQKKYCGGKYFYVHSIFEGSFASFSYKNQSNTFDGVVIKYATNIDSTNQEIKSGFIAVSLQPTSVLCNQSAASATIRTATTKRNSRLLNSILNENRLEQLNEATFSWQPSSRGRPAGSESWQIESSLMEEAWAGSVPVNKIEISDKEILPSHIFLLEAGFLPADAGH